MSKFNIDEKNASAKITEVKCDNLREITIEMKRSRKKGGKKGRWISLYIAGKSSYFSWKNPGYISHTRPDYKIFP